VNAANSSDPMQPGNGAPQNEAWSVSTPARFDTRRSAGEYAARGLLWAGFCVASERPSAADLRVARLMLREACIASAKALIAGDDLHALDAVAQ